MSLLFWHDQLGHPVSVMMRKIFEISCEHPLKNHKILQYSDFLYTICFQRKLIIKPSPRKNENEFISFLEWT